MSKGSYTLNYWNVPGRGESIRVILALGGIKFENNFVPLPLPLENPENQNPPPFDDGTWGELKPQTPWGTLPTLLLPSGEIIGQQRAILRYLGKLIKFEGNYLYPEEPEASARVDGFMDMMEDIWPILIGLNGTDSMETAPLYSTMLGQGTLDDFLNPRMEKGSGELATLFDFLENAISDEGPFLLGSNPSCADILLFAAISWWGAAVFPNMDKILEGRPKIEKSIRAVGTIREISDYYSSLKASRDSMPIVGSTNYASYYKNYHLLCGLNE